MSLALRLLLLAYFLCTVLCGIDVKISTLFESPQRPLTRNRMIFLLFVMEGEFGGGIYTVATKAGKMEQSLSRFLQCLLGTPTS